MEITIDLTNALSFAARLDQAVRGDYLKRVLIDALLEVAEQIVMEMWTDPSIPQVYKEALAVVEEPGTGRVIIGVVYDRSVIIEKGSPTDWVVYKCSKRAYYGGKLTKAYEGKHYIAEYWRVHREEILQRILDAIHRRLLDVFKA